MMSLIIIPHEVGHLGIDQGNGLFRKSDNTKQIQGILANTLLTRSSCWNFALEVVINKVIIIIQGHDNVYNSMLELY
jgi:hypothetical protein